MGAVLDPLQPSIILETAIFSLTCKNAAPPELSPNIPNADSCSAGADRAAGPGVWVAQFKTTTAFISLDNGQTNK